MDKSPNPNETLKKYLRRLKIMHFGLVAGMLFISLFVYVLQKNPLPNFPGENSTLFYLVPVAALTGYFAGIYIFNKLLNPLETEQKLSLKLARYQTASLLHYTCLEAPALLALYAYMIQGYLFYAAIAVFLILYLFAQRPTRVKIVRRIPLSDQENEALR